MIGPQPSRGTGAGTSRCCSKFNKDFLCLFTSSFLVERCCVLQFMLFLDLCVVFCEFSCSCLQNIFGKDRFFSMTKGMWFLHLFSHCTHVLHRRRPSMLRLSYFWSIGWMFFVRQTLNKKKHNDIELAIYYLKYSSR